MTPLDAAAPALALPMAKDTTRLKAIGVMCLAVICFTCLDTSAKYVVTHTGVPPLEVAWIRYLGAALFTLPFINPWKQPGLLRTKRPMLQTGRSLLLFVCTFFNFIALQYLQLTETITLVFTTPFWVALIAGLVFGQWLGARQWVAIGFGFLGVLVVARPGLGGLHWAALLVLAGAVCYALYSHATRMLASTDSTNTTVAYTALAGTLALTPAMPSVWVTPPDLLTWGLLIIAGFFGFVGHWLIVLAHRKTPAQDLSPFMYSQIVWMALSSWLVFGDYPAITTVIGAGIVILSGLYLLWLDRGRLNA